MQDKEIWEHLSKELAKANTVLDLSQRLLKSILFERTRYNIFTSTVLDSYTRVIFLSIHNLFDEKFSWNLYSLSGLTVIEKNKIQALRTKSEKYIDVRHREVGHSSRRVKLEKHNRFQRLPNNELEKVKELFREISRFLNAYGMRKFNEGYTFHYGGPDTSLQCLIEDLEKIR
ncbi:MAG: hypothetical protein AAB453_04165 [Patescibacteria group bacterium]